MALAGCTICRGGVSQSSLEEAPGQGDLLLPQQQQIRYSCWSKRLSRFWLATDASNAATLPTPHHIFWLRIALPWRIHTPHCSHTKELVLLQNRVGNAHPSILLLYSSISHSANRIETPQWHLPWQPTMLLARAVPAGTSPSHQVT